MTEQRTLVLAKSNGHCWYCGATLSGKWHVDHVKPIRRFENVETTPQGIRKFMDCDHPERDCFDNLVPACAPCNLFKGGHSVEGFRAEIAAQVDRAMKYSVNFRTAMRFGLVELTHKPVVFWFEKQH